MKKYNLNLKENEELIVDCDDLMETELAKFKEKFVKLCADENITLPDVKIEDIKIEE